jgi:hypothetical protein
MAEGMQIIVVEQVSTYEGCGHLLGLMPCLLKLLRRDRMLVSQSKILQRFIGKVFIVRPITPPPDFAVNLDLATGPTISDLHICNSNITVFALSFTFEVYVHGSVAPDRITRPLMLSAAPPRTR